MLYKILEDFEKVSNVSNELIIKYKDILPEEIDLLDIPKKERTHSFNKTAGEELKHASIIKACYEYLKKKSGKMCLMLDKYMGNIGIKICLSDENIPFITSELPSQVVRNLDGQNEHIFVPIPNNINTKDSFSQNGLNTEALLYKSLKNNEFKLPVATVNKIIPTKAKAIPIEQMKTYFHAASIECFVLWKYIKYALANVVPSMKIQETPKFVLKIAPVIENTKNKTMYV